MSKEIKVDDWESINDVPENVVSEANIAAIVFKNVRAYGKSLLTKSDKTFGINQDEAAEALGLAKSHFAKLESGELAIKFSHISMLCRACSVSLVFFHEQVEKIVEESKDKGWKIVYEKLPPRLDSLLWENKVVQKSEALFNKTIRTMKKDRTFDSLSESNIAKLKKKLKADTVVELEKENPKDDALFEKMRQINRLS